jgi:hypothetical protein
MRGFPPLHLILLTLIFAIIGIPLYRLTTAGPVTQRESEPVAGAKTAAYIRLKYAHRPTELTAKLGTEDLMKGVSLDENSLEKEVEISIPPDGFEIILSAKWPEGTPDTALTLEVEPAGLDSKKETRWTSGSPELNEVIVFDWP